MEQLSLTGASLGQLLACWAPIGTRPGSLYEAMFLTPALLQQDPGAQTATVGPVLSDGDILTTAINSMQVSSYTVVPGDTPAQIATTIAQAINAATVHDPHTGLPVNSRFDASTVANVITIKTGFTLACSPRPRPYLCSRSAISAAADRNRHRRSGLQETRCSPPSTASRWPIPSAAGDTPATLAAGIAAADQRHDAARSILGATANGLVVASSAAAVVTITGTTPTRRSP